MSGTSGANSADSADRTKTGVVIVGVGGQGSVFIARVLGEAAMRAGIGIVVSELHGMAQRGGAVHSAVVLGDVHGAIIAPGEADLLIALEPLEALRALRTLRRGAPAVVNRAPIVPFTVTLGGPAYPDVDDSLARIGAWADPLIAADFTKLSIDAGERRAVGAALIGAADGLGRLPFEGGLLRDVVIAMAPPKKRDANAAAFDAGRAVVTDAGDRSKSVKDGSD